jgi:predicted nucleic acid-binding protein
VILIDTSVWIGFFRNNDPSVSNQLIEFLENRIAVGISAVFGELLQGAKNEEEEKIILEFWKNVPKVNELGLFLEAGRLSNRHKLFSKGVGLIDCYILAAARTNNLNLWTFDKKLFDAFQILTLRPAISTQFLHFRLAVALKTQLVFQSAPHSP